MRMRLRSLIPSVVGGIAVLMFGLGPLDWHRPGSPAFANPGNGASHVNSNAGGGNGNGSGAGNAGNGNGGGGGNGNGGTGNGHGGNGNGKGSGNGNGSANGNGNSNGNDNGGNSIDGAGSGNAAGQSGSAGSQGVGSGGLGVGAKGSGGPGKGAVGGGTGLVSPAAVPLVGGGDGKPAHAPDDIVAAGLSERDLLRLVRRGFRIGEQTEGKLGARIVRLFVPKGMSVTTARRIVSALDRAAAVELDDYYYTDGFESACTAPQCAAPQMIGWTEAAAEACGTVPVIGLIDTRIDVDQPALAGQPIETIEEPGASGAASSPDHGTAIAALLVGRPGSVTPGLLPGARLIAVDAFYQAGGRERTDVERLIAAIEMLSDRGVRVINLSLSGPPNKLLEKAIAAAVDKGVVVIAAAGNKGPGAEPAYPAAYPGVVAVTAIDRDLRIYARATRGNYIGLSAPGVDVWTASVPDGGAPRSGTSYAVPFVSAAAAVLRALHPDLAASAVKGTLYASARDLGGKGHDPVFGWGLVQAASLCVTPGDRAVTRSAAEVEPADAIGR